MLGCLPGFLAKGWGAGSGEWHGVPRADLHVVVGNSGRLPTAAALLCSADRSSVRQRPSGLTAGGAGGRGNVHGQVAWRAGLPLSGPAVQLGEGMGRL